ncbi:Guanylate cyclase 32E, partial [Stegodyphus mimosarum]
MPNFQRVKILTYVFRGLLRDEIEEDAKKAFQSYMSVVPSSPIGFEDFSQKIPSGGAYLYDAVYVYGRALNECLLNKQDPYDGRGIMKFITKRSYMSAMGYMVYMDQNGDVEGNYSLISRKQVPGKLVDYGLYPVGVFQLSENQSTLPILKFLSEIDWVGGIQPLDEPICGFHGSKCVGSYLFTLSLT